MRLHVAQCLCGPARHAICALAKEATTESADELLEMLIVSVTELLGGQVIGGRCGLCEAPASQWVYEVKTSIEFPDWDTAQQALQSLEAENLASRLWFDRLRRRSTN